MSNNTPEIRFRGYTHAWEQRTLGEVTTKIGSGKTPKGGNAVYLQTGIPLLRSQNIVNDEIDFSDVAYISEPMDAEMANSRVRVGDILLNITGASIGRSAVYRLSHPANVNQHVCIIRPESGINGNFIQLNLTSQNGQQQIENNQAGGGREGLNFQQIAKIAFGFPPTVEQTAIGNFFRTLDDTITLHKRKLDTLKELKRGYLQQMFPQVGESVPRIRFAGFTEPWQVRKLGDVSIKVTDKNRNNEFNETLTNSAEYGIINQREFFDKNISNEKNLDDYFIVRPNDFVYNPRISSFAPVGPIKRNLLGRTGVMSPLYYVFRITEGDYTFVEKYFETAYWHAFMILNGDNGVRSDRFNIKDSLFIEIPIPFPSIEEQILIGNFFRHFDDQIAIQQEKLRKLKQLKTAYLQKMLI